MRLVIQRVQSAAVEIAGETVGSIGQGLMVLVGIGKGDSEATADGLAKKTAELRIFSDDNDKMNRSLIDIAGGCLVVSQFTLYADCTQGRRPFFGNAEAPARASELCDRYANQLKALGITVQTGRFGANMQVSLCNDGPVTIILEA